MGFGCLITLDTLGVYEELGNNCVFFNKQVYDFFKEIVFLVINPLGVF
jgi:hypothetical protein